jgi:hypothetical protein
MRLLLNNPDFKRKQFAWLRTMAMNLPLPLKKYATSLYPELLKVGPAK